MPETASAALSPVPPRLIVLKPTGVLAKTSGRPTLASRRCVAGPSPILKEQAQNTSCEWIDVDHSPPQRRKTRESSQRRERTTRGGGSDINQRGTEGELGRFFPKLSKISEANETVVSSRSSTRSLETQRRDQTATRRRRRRDEASTGYRRPVRRRAGNFSKGTDVVLTVNPSLLSVLTSLTETSEKSSGSNSTITQESYDRSDSDSRRTQLGRPPHSDSRLGSVASSEPPSNPPNVFDYMVPSPLEDGQDGHFVLSSSSSDSDSDSEPSDVGSSEAPGTPSSRSTLPSPIATRSQSVAELRRGSDNQSAASNSPAGGNSHSPVSYMRSVAKHPSVSDVTQYDEDDAVGPTAPLETSCDDTNERSSSRSSKSSRRSSSRLQKQEESMRQHMAYATQAQQNYYVNPAYVDPAYVDPAYVRHSSCSAASEPSDGPAHVYQMAMQQYRWPSPPSEMANAVPPEALNGHVNHLDRPCASDAPDLSRRTLAGYETLALELSSNDSPVRPLYRKFEYLNHRILLHLQDELCELEEQLRTVDEVIAQMDPALIDGHRTPASRRGETYNGAEIHNRRTNLLGRIFLKTEQYNRAMSAYASMAKDSRPASEGLIRAYRHWMAKHSPVHEIETRFLQREEDLVLPGKQHAGIDQPTKHAAIAYLPVALMLPLLLFSIIPTLAGRLAATALIAVGAFIVAATTHTRKLMPPREWAVCGAAYVLLMAALAGCIPQHRG